MQILQGKPKEEKPEPVGKQGGGKKSKNQQQQQQQRKGQQQQQGGRGGGRPPQQRPAEGEEGADDPAAIREVEPANDEVDMLDALICK